ncbi:MAG: putative N6-adenine-specific DNA methylase [Myxococcota bacterium]|jgi:putative N6-adenine-specific DNA methylase
MSWHCFASVTPGMEDALAEELREIGIAGKSETGGVRFTASQAGLYGVQLQSRVAARVTVRLGRFRASQYDQLAKQVRQLPWSKFVHPNQPLQVRATSHTSRLRHRDAVERKVAHAIGDALRGPRLPGPRPPREPALVIVRLVDDMVDISIDASGEGLHKRGWRQESGRAPIRENLAAGVLRMAGWAPGVPLVDPMCGSGTFVIEAALAARGRAPGLDRSFACQHWPAHDRKEWARAISSARAGGPHVRTTILGADRDARALDSARANARRAGVVDDLTWEACGVSSLQPPDKAGLLVANPPYGKRLEVGNASKVFRDFGRVLRTRWQGWRLAVLVPDRRLLGPLGLAGLEAVSTFRNGGVRVTLVVGAVSQSR